MKRWSLWLFLFVTFGLGIALWVQQRALRELRSAAESASKPISNTMLVSSTPVIPSSEQESQHEELLRLRNQVALLRAATNDLASELRNATNALQVTRSAYNAHRDNAAANTRRWGETISKLQAEVDAKSDRPTNPPRVGAWLGIQMQDVSQFAAALGIDKGVLIGDMVRQGPAERAGLKAGDIIVKVDDREVAGPSELKALLTQKAVSQVLALDIFRDGKPIKVEVRTREWPN
jgi:C-terminal processing protease CtpA/Prc